MDFFNLLTLVGGLAMFLYGMHVMGMALEQRAGNQMKTILANLTSSTLKGFFLGLGVTAVIQSSSATTVMVVGFVNSGVMTLRQSIGVIMGANIGTSVTAWILSLAGIDGESFWIQILKPSSFTPILAMIGAILYLFMKNNKKKDVGLILLGFAVLMYGMDSMSAAVEPLADIPEFTQIMTLFQNPVLGVIVGAVLTAIIQSSSASVGILQALSMTGSVTYNAAIPIIMGQNIGTCITAIISSVGATKNAKRVALIHLYFNVIATVVILTLYSIVTLLIPIPLTQSSASPLGIAILHTAFNVLAVILWAPCIRYLEKLAYLSVRDGQKNKEEVELLDERLLVTPAVAIGRCKTVANTMAKVAVEGLKLACAQIEHFNPKSSDVIRSSEEEVDMYEDKLGTYLVKLSSCSMSMQDSHEVSKLLHIIGDFERISDYSVNILASVEEISDKKLAFSEEAQKELKVLTSAVTEILDLSYQAFCADDLQTAAMVEPLEQVVDYLKNQLKNRHIERLQRNECTIEMGFILSDLLNYLERTSDHCSNIAGCLIEISKDSLGMHEYLQGVKYSGEKDFTQTYDMYRQKYAL